MKSTEQYFKTLLTTASEGELLAMHAAQPPAGKDFDEAKNRETPEFAARGDDDESDERCPHCGKLIHVAAQSRHFGGFKSA
jgi:hypothetical protein